MFGLAGHALRTRTGLGSDRLPGGIAAAAAPFAVASGGALAVLYVVTALSGRTGGNRLYGIGSEPSYACCPGSRCWSRRGRALGLGLLPLAGAVVAGVKGMLVQLAIPAGLFALILLAAPPDLPSSSRAARTRLAAATVLAGLPLSLLGLHARTLIRFVTGAILLGAMIGVGSRRVLPSAIVLAVVPWLLIADSEQLTFNLLVVPYTHSATDLIILVAVVSAALTLGARAAWERWGSPPK